MGSLNPFSKPKMPAPAQVVQPAPILTNTQPTTPEQAITTKESEAALLEERKRRASAVGSTGNIVSSLANATSDVQANTRRSTLLGG